MRNFFETHIPVDEKRNNRRVDRCDSRCLSRCKNTAVDAADDHDDEQQPPKGAYKCLPEFHQGWPRLPGHTLFNRHYPGDEQEHTAQHQTRYDAGDEHLAHRLLSGNRIDDHDNRRRNQNPQAAGRRNGAHGKRL